MSQRFDYVQYDYAATNDQAEAKALCLKLEEFIERLKDGRAKSLALTRLEECYAWIGKAIRDEQIQRTGHSTDLPARNHS